MPDYKQPKMVNWYQPQMLLNIGLKAVVSGVFGNYADRRELESALGSLVKDDDQFNRIQQEYGGGSEIWIDFVSDTGDGFNSTFAIAKTVAQPELVLKTGVNGETTALPRGRILVFGGDEVYPFPTKEMYEDRFKTPYESASSDLRERKAKEGRPDMYAIPGNHDWYDGLGNFIKLFCQQRTIGIWNTRQHRSYFALPLPNHYWIWATDIQLNSDIDAPQLDYFKNLARTRMEPGDKVILVTAEPAWIYNRIRQKDLSFERLQFFINECIHDKDNCTGKKFRLAATVTGDLHHYSRYCDQNSLHGHQYITAGGGGAFLHLTHNLPMALDAIRKGQVQQQAIFPSKADSTKLLLGNFLFPFINWRFTGMLWGIYLFFFWVLSDQPDAFFPAIIRHPGLACMTLILIASYYGFSDRNVRAIRTARAAGLLHALGQAVLLWWVLTRINDLIPDVCSYYGDWCKLPFIIAGCLAGSLVSGLFMGVYLYFSNRVVNMHIDGASSSLVCPDFKNFLRIRVHKRGITIYPIGIRRVPRKWTQRSEDDNAAGDGQDEWHQEERKHYFFEADGIAGHGIEAHLIEEPIEILDDQLKF